MGNPILFSFLRFLEKSGIIYITLILGVSFMKDIILNIRNKVKNDSVVVACSSGVDSCVLLDLCMKALNKSQIIVAHVNHGVRSESLQEEEYLKQYLEEQNIICEVAHFSFDDMANFENAARSKRYSFFEDVAGKYHAKYILLAHHANDNLETMLMRFIKQSSLKGYAGIEEESFFKDFILYRPLLKISRLEIEDYANNNNIKYFNDITNYEYDHMRNRIRLDVVPLLLKENPNLIEAVNYYSESLLGAANLLEDIVSSYILNNVDEDANVIKFGLNNFLKLSSYLQKEVLFTILKPYGFSRALINELLKIINSDKNKVVSKLLDNLTFVKEYGTCTFIKNMKIVENFYLKVESIGTYELINNAVLEVDKNNCYYKAGKEVVCYNVLSMPFVIRSRRDGDRIRRKRVNKKTKEVSYYTQKVNDVLTNKKISYFDRVNTLVVTNELDEVVIILGLTIS